MVGIENLKKVASAIIGLGMQLEKSTADGFQLTDIFSFIPVLSEIPGLLQNKRVIVDEFKDLTPEENAQLVTFIEQNFTLNNKRTEQVIEAALETAVSILNLIEKLKAQPTVVVV